MSNAGSSAAGSAGTTAGGTSGSAGSSATAGSAGEAAGASGEAGASARGFVYIESNDPDQNAVLAFERAADGSLQPLSGGQFATSGKGITAGTDQRLGPLDSDRELVFSDDRQYLFAVNSGSNTIAVFRTGSIGELTPIAGSPFPSGGQNPVSLGLTGDTLYVVNKAVAGTVAPNYVAFHVDDTGALTQIANSSVNAPVGGSPSIAYIPPSSQLLFGTEFLDGARAASAPAGQIDVFVRASSGLLTAAPGSPHALPADTSGIMPPPPPVALNLVANPSQSVLYVAFVTRNQLGVYSYDSTGALTFERTVANSGKAICWLVADHAAHFLYSVNSGSGTISTYDISNATQPAEVHTLTLKQAMSGPPFMDAMGMMETVTSQPFQLAFDADESHLYVISQRATTNTTDLTGNYLHTLQVMADGSLTEPADPIDLRDLSVSPQARPQGVAVF
jgi:6-phosphogluconolactonase (cycloisomerase 2 family)